MFSFAQYRARESWNIQFAAISSGKPPISFPYVSVSSLYISPLVHIPKLNKFFIVKISMQAQNIYGGGLTEFLFHVLADVQLLLYITAFFAVLSTHRCIYSFSRKIYIESPRPTALMSKPQSPPDRPAVIRATVCFKATFGVPLAKLGHIFSTDSVFFVCGELHSGNYVKTTPEKTIRFPLHESAIKLFDCVVHERVRTAVRRSAFQ